MKLVKEHINEKFVEDLDPIKDLGIGYYKLENICKDILNLDKRKKRMLISIYAYKSKRGIIFNIKDLILNKNVKNLKYKSKYTKYLIELLKELNYFHLFKIPTKISYNTEWLFKEKYKKNILVDIDPFYSAEVYYAD